MLKVAGDTSRQESRSFGITQSANMATNRPSPIPTRRLPPPPPSHHYRGSGDPYREHHRSRDPYDDYPPPSLPPPSHRSLPYKILCVANLNSKVSDGSIRDALIHEFSRFGDVSVKIIHDANERFAYLYFRCYEDAREARHAKYRLVLFDKPVEIDPIYEKSSSSSGYRSRRSLTPEYGHPRPRGQSPYRRPPTHHLPPPSRGPIEGRHSSSSAYVPSSSRSGYRDERDRYPPEYSPHREIHRSSSRDYISDRHHPPPASNSASNNGSSRTSTSNTATVPRESKKDKFPNYLHHVAPEEDDKSTRTLFVGNLEVAIPDAELRRIFERYGVVEDIDVKRPPPGQGNAYAFIKFLNLDMAHRAKVEMSGQYIGKFQCKIGYGKATPTTRIWVGGLGQWTSLSTLEREFDRFGAIRKIDFVKGDTYAYIQYDSIDAAQAACQDMRGFPLGGPDKRLRVDFADPGPYSGEGSSPTTDADGTAPVVASRTPPPEHENGRSPNGSVGAPKIENDVSGVTEPKRMRLETSSPVHNSTEESDNSVARSPVNEEVFENVQNIGDLVSATKQIWLGALKLKNSFFPCSLSLCSGDGSLVGTLLSDLTEPDAQKDDLPLLKINQRLRLDPSKLEDVTKRMSASNNKKCLMVATPLKDHVYSTTMKGDGGEELQLRQLKNLVTYFKTRESAGVVTLTGPSGASNGDKAVTAAASKEIHGVLYVFSSCDFSTDLIKKVAPNFVTVPPPKEDYLVLVLMRTSA